MSEDQKTEEQRREQAEAEWWQRREQRNYSWEGLKDKPWDGWQVWVDERDNEYAVLISSEDKPVLYSIDPSRLLAQGGVRRDATLQDYWRADPESGRLRLDKELKDKDNLVTGTDGKIVHIFHRSPDSGTEPVPMTDSLKQEVLARMSCAQSLADRVAKDVSFRDSIISIRFDGGVFLKGLPWSREKREIPPVCFVWAFLVEANFFDTKFDGKANFVYAKFVGAANFVYAKFVGEANFGYAKFDGDANFGYAKFDGDANFVYAKFVGLAAFTLGTFGGEAAFTGAEFEDEARFSCGAFDGEANFSSATFGLDADFRDVRFSGSTKFENARFRADAIFYKAEWVHKDTENIGCESWWRAAFYGVHFAGLLNWNGVRHLHVSAFSGAVIGKAITLSPESDDEAAEHDLALKGAQGAGEESEKALHALENGAARLKRALEQEGHTLRAQHFRKLEIRAQCEQAKTSRTIKCFSLGYRTLSDYGLSLSRPFWGLVICSGFFAIAYELLGLLPCRSASALGDGIILSLMNVFRPFAVFFTTSADNPLVQCPVPDSGGLIAWLKLILAALRPVFIILQSIMSLFLLFLLALGLRRRFGLG